VRKVQGSTGEKNLFGLDRRSIKAATPEIVAVACTRGREDIEILVENIADLSQMEHKSSQRKGVSEMLSDIQSPEQRRLADLAEGARKSKQLVKFCIDHIQKDGIRKRIKAEIDPPKNTIRPSIKRWIEAPEPPKFGISI
jgi:hypothetical protein